MALKYQNHVKHYQMDARYFDYFSLNEFMEDEIARRYQAIVHLLKPTIGQKILEIGSGGGQLLEHLPATDFFYVPLDLALSNLKKITQKYTQKNLPVVGDVFTLPFHKETFDIIILSEVLEHLDRPLLALKECHRVLKPAGKFIVSVPYKEVIPYYICIHCNQPTPKNGHLHSFDFPKLAQWVESAGFVVLKSFKFLNKIFNRLHLSLAVKNLPFPIWQRIDGFFNFLMDRPTSLILLCRKKSP
ncbi:class I SAM-dependent methyltransferase [Calditrichota bacterium LG25]